MFRRDFTLSGPVHGMSVSAALPGQQVQVARRGFFTSDDGPILYTCLDGFFATVLGQAGVRPEDIDTAFVSIVDDTAVTVLINPSLQMQIVAKAPVAVGQAVHIDHIADIASVTIPGFTFPERGAFAYIFQHGWRRGFYFDLTGQSPDANKDRALGDVGALLGSLHTALMMRDRIRMTPDVLLKMAATGWFPFTRLSHVLAVALYRDFANGWSHEKTEQAIVDELGPQAVAMVESWALKPAFAAHMDVLRTGARLYAAGEFVAAASVLMPKVEGVLRHLYQGAKRNPNAPELRRELVGRVRANVEGFTALLPESFMQYLETFFYAGFNLATGELPPSRNTFLHGVGPDDELKRPVYALRLLLTLDQIFFFTSRMSELP